jgi:hypothetical protein
MAREIQNHAAACLAEIIDEGGGSIAVRLIKVLETRRLLVAALNNNRELRNLSASAEFLETACIRPQYKRPWCFCCTRRLSGKRVPGAVLLLHANSADYEKLCAIGICAVCVCVADRVGGDDGLRRVIAEMLRSRVPELRGISLAGLRDVSPQLADADGHA